VFFRKITHPMDLEIIPRNTNFNFQNSMEENRYVCGGDPILTHFINALQSMFPEGERMFIESAIDCIEKYSGKKTPDSKLMDDFHKFSRQEATHGFVHMQWTAELVKLGYEKMSEFTSGMKEFRVKVRKRMDPLRRLSITAAAEHYTASIAHVVISGKSEIISTSAVPYNAVLLYHAMEEVEHKSVCYDLYTFFSGNYLLRLWGYFILTYRLFSQVYKRMHYLLDKDGLWNREGKKMVRKFFFGRRGLFWNMLPRLIAYLNPFFRPWNTDEREAIENTFGILREGAGIQPFHSGGR